MPSELLTRPAGGVTIRLTQYGYPGDPYSDSETRKGHGAYHSPRVFIDGFTHALWVQMHYGVENDLAAACLWLLAAVVAGGSMVALGGRWRGERPTL